MTTYTHNPAIELEFYTSQGQHFFVRDLLAYQSNRTLDNPTARASFMLKGIKFGPGADKEVRGKEVSNVLGLYDLCKVWMRDGKGKRWLEMIGLVSDDALSISESSGSPDYSQRISLVGLGEALERYQIFWHPHIAGRNNLGGIGFLVRSGGSPPKGRPDEVLSQLYDAFLNDQYVFTLADGRKLTQVLRRRFSTITDSLSVTGLAALGAEGALWATLKRYADCPWNELFVDVEHETNNPITQAVYGGIETGATGLTGSYGDGVGVYLRSTPFDQDRWRELAKAGSGWGFTYSDSDRMGGGEQLHRNTDSIYNFFWVPGKAVLSAFDQLSSAYDQSGGKLPIYDEYSIRHYGLRRFEQQTEYVEFLKTLEAKQGNLSATDKTLMRTRATRMSELLVLRTEQAQRWFGYNNFWTGTFTTRGRLGTDPEHGARVGGVITRKRDGKQFYITGISQNWQFPGPHTTTLTVTRGHDLQEYARWVAGLYTSDARL